MIELEQFGWNMITFGFLGAMVTGALGFWGVIQQAQSIWSQRSGRSVSVFLFTHGSLFFAAGCIYGISIGSLALIIMGGRLLVHIPILIGLWKFKGFKWWETASGLLFLAVFVAMVTSSHQDWFYFVISLGAAISIVPQLVELLIKPCRGAVDVRFLWIMLIGATFWTFYALAIGDWVLSIANPLFLMGVLATLVAWYAAPAERLDLDEPRDQNND
ncbi:hypothetical protein KKF05_01515 [Patescibacteria group bacterium]|nr:hypothetical protein [Patescibacteria group bacterium]MBU1916122.1 hypothetical protein [Patescibacteria group bacterium]